MKPMHDWEHCYFSLKSNSEKIMGLMGNENGSEVICTGNIEWFTARWNEKIRQYVLYLGKHSDPSKAMVLPHWVRPRYQVLDEDEGSSKIQVWREGFFGPGDNQKWIFEAAPSHPYYRIKNVSTGRYLTYNPPDNRVWGYKFSESDDQIWEKH